MVGKYILRLMRLLIIWFAVMKGQCRLRLPAIYQILMQLSAYLIGGDIAATKKWLALSPRRRLGDVAETYPDKLGDNQFARISRGRRRDVSGSRGDVSETSSQLRRRLR